MFADLFAETQNLLQVEFGVIQWNIDLKFFRSLRS